MMFDKRDAVAQEVPCSCSDQTLMTHTTECVGHLVDWGEQGLTIQPVGVDLVNVRAHEGRSGGRKRARRRSGAPGGWCDCAHCDRGCHCGGAFQDALKAQGMSLNLKFAE